MTSHEPPGKKLWIGNLDKRLSEYVEFTVKYDHKYDLLKIIQQCGEVENFKYLFHTIGPNKGEPRTYCFVEYKKREDAEYAIQKLNGKTIHSQPLRVHWAEENVKIKDTAGSKLDVKASANDTSREEKIKAIEGKLKLMEQPADKCKPRPLLFHGKHRLLVQSDQTKELSRRARQKSRRPYTKK